MTSKVWEVMNDLEMVTAKIVSAREIIDTAVDKLQEHQYDRAETLAMAAYEFLGYYLNEFDEKFKLAWKETVVKPNNFDYTSTEEKKSWTNFWEECYYPDEYKGSSGSSVQYTDEELNAMCDKAASDEEKEKCREYNLREAEYYDKRVKLDMNSTYDDMIAAGYEMTGDGFWMPPQKKKTWVLPVEECKDTDTDKTEYFVSFPQDLLEAAKLNEGDEVEWIDNDDGTYILRKITKPLGMNEC